MNLLADESVDRPIVERLRNDQHSVLYIADMKKGIPDDEVLHLANQNNALLVTLDKDFGELVFRKKMISQGVLLVRLAGIANAEKAEIVSTVLKNYNEKLYNNFSVITSKSIRIRNVYYRND